MKVRVVDDEPDIAVLIQMGLEIEGFDVVTTSEHFESLLSPEPWDGISHAIIDWRLNGSVVQGSEILGFLAQNFPDIKRILFSADSNIVVDPLLYDRYYTKPFSTMEIIEAMRKEEQK